MALVSLQALQKDEGAEIAKNLGVKTLWVNDKGEYFTSENLALFSVKNNPELLRKLDY
ncbi:hypothetical protein D3C86_2203290 [compost metagenome]